MRLDRAVREVQPLRDVAVGEPLRRELGDLQLLRAELVERVRRPPAAALARGAQLAAGAPGPRAPAPRGGGGARPAPPSAGLAGGGGGGAPPPPGPPRAGPGRPAGRPHPA